MSLSGFSAYGADSPAAVGPPMPPMKPAPPGPVMTPGPVVTPADPWAEAMSAFATADDADAHAGGVVFVGSSSIRLWADLEKRYASYAAVNRGFGGSTLADCVKHMDQLVLPHKPRLVVIYAGDNDLAGGRTADQVLLDFVELASRIQEQLPKTQIVFVSIKPSPARIDLLGRIREANTKIRDYITTKRYLRYVDVFTPMLDANGKPRGELFGSDSLHLNAEGYALWHSLISPVLPTDEQPAMMKPPTPKDAAPAKPDDGVMKSAAAEAVSPAKPAVPAVDVAQLAKAPGSAQAVRANPMPADPPPSMPAPAATTTAPVDAARAPTPEAPSAAPAKPAVTELARLPPPPHAVPANLQPADAVPTPMAVPANIGGAEPPAAGSKPGPQGGRTNGAEAVLPSALP